MRKFKPNAKELSESKLAELKENASGILADVRRQLLNEKPFIGSVIMQMETIPVRDIRIPTACTDGRRILFDIDFLSSLNNDDRKFVLAHEVYHGLLAHMLRNGGRDHEIMNIATDIEVNECLKLDGMSVPASACLADKFNLPLGHNAEDYYEMLINQQKQPQQQQSSSGNCGSGNSNDNNPSGNKDGKLQGQFDKHVTDQDNIDSEQPQPSDEGDLCDKYGKLGFDKDVRLNPSKENAERMREAAISAAQEIERRKGDLPAHLKRLIDNMLKPTISWKDVLQSFVTRSVGSDPDWNRPNRRFVSSRTYLPSKDSETIKVGVIIDTSGSTAADMPKFLGEVNGLVKTFSGYELTVIECDAEVGRVQSYNEDEPLDLESEEYEVTGGGGTAMSPAFQHIADNEIDVDCVICFTDGYIEEIDENPTGLPTLWVISPGGTSDSLKFGEVVMLDAKDFK